MNPSGYLKIIDRINISIIILILFLSFISLNNQRKWTIFYSSMLEIRNKNNNVFDYISNTEQYFLNEIENQTNIKNTNPDDLIYLIKTKEKEGINFFSKAVIDMSKGFHNGKYQRGY
tara:strand:- start:502 stop:852 length:351 start_codon:yes stop_codon:yes gene_type:complete